MEFLEEWRTSKLFDHPIETTYAEDFRYCVRGAVEWMLLE